MHETLLPGASAPELKLSLTGGEDWSLADQSDAALILIDFYRGLHCPRCKLHIVDLKGKLARFADRGVRCLAVSMDPQDRAMDAMQRWELDGLDLAYGLTEAQARAWGLYLTDSINEREPRRFSEPAIIMVEPGSGIVYSAVYGTNPFNRVHVADILEGIDAMQARDYPPRGSVA